MIDYVIIGLLVLVLAVVVYSLYSTHNSIIRGDTIHQEFKSIEGALKLYFQKEYGELKVEMTRLFSEASRSNFGDISTFKERLVETLD